MRIIRSWSGDAHCALAASSHSLFLGRLPVNHAVDVAFLDKLVRIPFPLPQFLQDLRHALADVGFLYVIDHGVFRECCCQYHRRATKAVFSSTGGETRDRATKIAPFLGLYLHRKRNYRMKG